MTDEYVTITNVLIDTHVDPVVTIALNLSDLMELLGYCERLSLIELVRGRIPASYLEAFENSP